MAPPVCSGFHGLPFGSILLVTMLVPGSVHVHHGERNRRVKVASQWSDLDSSAQEWLQDKDKHLRLKRGLVGAPCGAKTCQVSNGGRTSTTSRLVLLTHLAAATRPDFRRTPNPVVTMLRPPQLSGSANASRTVNAPNAPRVAVRSALSARPKHAKTAEEAVHLSLEAFLTPSGPIPGSASGSPCPCWSKRARSFPASPEHLWAE